MNKNRNQTRLDMSKTQDPTEFFAKQVDIDLELKRQEDEFLHKWVNYIKAILDQTGEEFDWWFDTSAPYYAEIDIVLKSHRCFPNCVSFRFDSSKQLAAYDSHFDGGTSFVDINDRHRPGDVVKEVLDKVLAKKCQDNNYTHGWTDHMTDEEIRIKVQNHVECKKSDGWMDRDKMWKREEIKREEAKHET